MHTVVLLSGGYDSVYCAIRNPNIRETDHLFFEYGQPYLSEERRAIAALGNLLSIEIETIQIDAPSCSSGTFANRNETFLRMAAGRGAEEIYFGTRNVLPVFDKHGDSNWWWA